MRNRFGSSLSIGLTKTSVAVLHVYGWRGRHSAVLLDHTSIADETSPTDRLITPLRELFSTDKRYAGYSATVILADDWVRYFLVTPPVNASSLRDCEAAAALRFQTLYGEPVTGWRLKADWAYRRPFLACAIPETLLTSLHLVTDEYKLTLTGIVPHFVAVWNMWSAKVTKAWFGVVHSHSMTLALIDRQLLHAVRTVAIPPEARNTEHWLAKLIGREALRMNLPLPSQVQLCGDIPSQWLDTSSEGLTCTRLDQEAAPDGLALRLAKNRLCR